MNSSIKPIGLLGGIVVVSGYFNPLHAGHIDYLKGARKLGDVLIAIVNSDIQVKLKGSVSFMSQRERLVVVGALGCVQAAVPSIDIDGSVVKTLRNVWDKYYNTYDGPDRMIFANGGDRKVDDIPEYDLCKSLGIEMAFNVGGKKTQSSSDLIKGCK